MDQLDFEFKITIIGMEVQDFINSLNEKGFEYQVKQVEEQFKKQLENI